MSWDCPPASRPFAVKLLAYLKKVNRETLAGRIGRAKATLIHHLESPTLPDDVFEELVRALGASKAEVALATGLHEGLKSLSQSSAFPGEREVVELAVLDWSRFIRDLAGELGSLSRAKLPAPQAPRLWQIEPVRWQAEKRFKLLKGLQPPLRLKAAAIFTPLHTWAVVELAVRESAQAASRSPQEAFHWARIARQIARRVKGPDDWLRRVRALALGALANAERVAGRLRAADRTLEAAKRLWREGSDPDQILDPGWLLSFEASLRRAQRRFPEALACLDEARLVSHDPARILIKKGFTLEVMGDSEQAVAALSEAIPLLDPTLQPQLWYKNRSNLAVNLCNLGRHQEAAVLVQQAVPVAAKLGDKLDLIRLSWLSGRIARGLGQHDKALRLLEQAERAFARRSMWFDVALALIERASLLLQQRRMAEARAVSLGLVDVFRAEGVHREALAALQLFYGTVHSGNATAELGQDVVRYLLRARHDRKLRFHS